MSVTASLPPLPTVFHGRDEWVNNGVWLLVGNVAPARLAILGAGGMRKTSVTLALLYSAQIMEYCPDERLFLSCKALADANDVVISLAKILGVPASRDLLSVILDRLRAGPCTVLV